MIWDIISDSLDSNSVSLAITSSLDNEPGVSVDRVPTTVPGAADARILKFLRLTTSTNNHVDCIVIVSKKVRSHQWSFLMNDFLIDQASRSETREA
jgi:hypothetical protein